MNFEFMTIDTPPPPLIIDHGHLAQDPHMANHTHQFHGPPEVNYLLRRLIGLPDGPACGRIRIALIIFVHRHLLENITPHKQYLLQCHTNTDNQMD